MHDWWLALVAAAAGRIVWTREPLVRYRQHGANDTGAKRWGPELWARHARGVVAPAAYRERLRAYQHQAAALARHEAAAVPDPVRAVLRDFAALPDRPYWSRVAFLRRHGMLKTGVLRNLLFLLRA